MEPQWSFGIRGVKIFAGFAIFLGVATIVAGVVCIVSALEGGLFVALFGVLWLLIGLAVWKFRHSLAKG